MGRAKEPDEVDGVYRNSATKIGTFLECPRKFGWQYIEKIPRVEHASAALGSACHDMLERYLRDGTPLDYGVTVPSGARPAEIVAPGLHFLPERGPHVEVERYFKWDSPKGHRFIGYKDIEVAGEIPKVIDHKTTSSFQYKKSEAELRGDPQATIYAADTFARYPSAPAVDLEWIYYQTRGAKRSERTTLRVLRNDETFLRAVDAIELVAEDIAKHISNKTLVKDLRPNPRACEKYGGCPYQARCNLGPGEVIKSMANANTKGTSDLLARLEEQAGNTAPAPTPSDPSLAWLFAPKDPGPKPPAPAPPEPPARVSPPVNLDALLGPATKVSGAEAEQVKAFLAPAGASPFPATDMPINPPGEFQRAPTPEERTAADAAAKAEKAGPPKEGARIRRTAEEIALGLTLEQAKARRAGSPQTLADVTATLAMGRALKAGASEEDAERIGAVTYDAEAVQKAIAESGEMPSPSEKLLGVHIEPPEQQIAVERFEAPAPVKAPLSLYIDTLPVKGAGVEHITSIVAKVHAEIREEMKVLDYRQVDYGKGAGLLSYGVAHVAAERGGAWYLDTGTPEGMACKASLIAAASVVYQGVRS